MADPRFFPGAGGADDNGDRRSDAAGGRRLYNPYQDLQIPYKSLYDLPTSPEFLFLEESTVQRRSWGENLTYYTGVGYLAGAAGGAASGLRTAVAAAEPGESLKLRVNRVLNSCGGSGRRFGNTLGVIGLLYAGLESGMVAARGRDDWVNSIEGSTRSRCSAPLTGPGLPPSPAPPWTASRSPRDTCTSDLLLVIFSRSNRRLFVVLLSYSCYHQEGFLV